MSEQEPNVGPPLLRSTDILLPASLVAFLAAELDIAATCWHNAAKSNLPVSIPADTFRSLCGTLYWASSLSSRETGKMPPTSGVATTTDMTPDKLKDALRGLEQLRRAPAPVITSTKLTRKAAKRVRTGRKSKARSYYVRDLINPKIKYRAQRYRKLPPPLP